MPEGILNLLIEPKKMVTTWKCHESGKLPTASENYFIRHRHVAYKNFSIQNIRSFLL